MRTKKMRLISALLAVAMMFVMMPVGAFAADGADGPTKVTVNQNATTEKSGLQLSLEAQGISDFSTIKSLEVSTADGYVLHAGDFEFMSGIVTTGQSRNEVQVAPSGFTYLNNLEKVDLSAATCENNEIPAKAFFKNTKITKIILPQNVKRIGHHAFSAMYDATTDTGLCYLSTDKNVNLRFDGVEIFGESMASRDRKLTDSLELPTSLTAIGDSCFANSGVKGDITIRIDIDKNIDYDGEGTEQLSKAQFAGTDATNNGTSITSLTVANGVTRIPGFIAKNCKNLSSIVISDSVDEIGEQAFYGTGLSKVVIPEKVGTIAAQAFGNSDQLDTVVVENPNVSIGWHAFVGLKDGAKIYLASSIDNLINDNAASNRWDADKAIIFNTDGGTITHDSNGNVTAKMDDNGFYIPVKSASRFVAWETTDDGKTYTAKWEAIPDHQLTVTGGTFTVKDETVEIKTDGDKRIADVPEGAEVTVTFNKDAYADSNLVFGGWQIGGLADAENYTNKEEFTFTMPEKGVTIEAQTKTADTEDDSWDAATVVTGIAIGAGAAVLTYHIGTELYAKQILGDGVAIPRTRADVALKAWELAGKPAVSVDGEPLSEAAQAEKWAVESGLMQNVDGSFNGQKKMSKLKALRTLDSAKKMNAQ